MHFQRPKKQKGMEELTFSSFHMQVNLSSAMGNFSFYNNPTITKKAEYVQHPFKISQKIKELYQDFKIIHR